MRWTILISLFLSQGIPELADLAKQGTVNSEKASKPLVAIRPAPEFSLTNVVGGEVNSRDLKGKVVVVEFWATWATPAKVVFPDYNLLRKKLSGQGVEFLAVTFASGTTESIVSVANQLQVEFPVVLGTEEVDRGFGGHPGYPTTFLIGKDWNVYRRIVGSTQNKIPNLEKDILALVAQP